MIDVAFWTIVALLALNALGVILSVGKPREPTSPGTAAAVVAVNATFVVVLIAVYYR